MHWLEAFHIIFVVTWFAGLFYLPRLFVYAARNPAGEAHRVLLTMQRKLLVMTHIGGALAVGFGLSMLLTRPICLQMGWMHAKLSLVLLLIGYHLWCARLVRVFRDNGRDGLSFLVASMTKYVPIGQVIELNMGPDPSVVHERVLVRAWRDNFWFQGRAPNVYFSPTQGHRIEPNYTVAGWDDHERWVERIRNDRDDAIDVGLRGQLAQIARRPDVPLAPLVEHGRNHLDERCEDGIVRRARHGAMEFDVVNQERLRIVQRLVDLIGCRCHAPTHSRQ